MGKQKNKSYNEKVISIKQLNKVNIVYFNRGYECLGVKEIDTYLQSDVKAKGKDHQTLLQHFLPVLLLATASADRNRQSYISIQKIFIT